MTSKSKSSSEKFTCKFCKTDFSRERTLAVHLCEKKRRHKQQNETGPRIGLAAYNQFYQSTQSGKAKTYEEFSASNYYKAFVKFGWYVNQIRAVDIERFVAFLLKHEVKLDWWCKDRYYEQFVIDYMYKEAASDAVARTIEELDRWGREGGEDFTRFFEIASLNKIAMLISNGRLSPWFLFNCDQGVATIGKFDETQLAMAFKWIEPDRWGAKFEKYPEDVEWVRNLLDEAGFNA